MCVAGLGPLVFGFIEQPRLGWGEPAVPGRSPGGAALLVAFVFYESRTAMPMLPLRLFRSRNFSADEHRDVRRLRRALRVGLLPHALPAADRRLLAVPGRPRDRAADDRDVPALALCRAAVDALRPASLHGGRPAARRRVDARARAPPTHLNYWVDLFPPLVGFAVALALTVAPLTTTVLNDAGPGDAGIASGINNAVARVAGPHRDRRDRRRRRRRAPTTSPSGLPPRDADRRRAARRRRRDRRRRHPQPEPHRER